jgi:hypothetical protein
MSVAGKAASGRLTAIERDIVATRAALGRTLEELAHQLTPRPAQRLVQTGLDITAGTIGEASLNQGLEFVRANPIAAALIGCGAMLAVFGRFSDGDAGPAKQVGPCRGDAAAPSAIPAKDGLGAMLNRHPALLAAIGLSAGALVATLLASMRSKPAAVHVPAGGADATGMDTVEVPEVARPADHDRLVRAH